MDLIDKIDSVILGYFTKFSHWFQGLTGRTNFFLAYVFLTHWVMCMVLDVFNFWIPVLSIPTSIPFVCINSLMIIQGIFMGGVLKDTDKRFSISDTKPRIQLLYGDDRMVIVRVLATIVGVIGTPYLVFDTFISPPQKGVFFFEVYSKLSLVFMTFYLYFVIVSPLPPGKSKVRQWIESLRLVFSKPHVAGVSQSRI